MRAVVPLAVLLVACADPTRSERITDIAIDVAEETSEPASDTIADALTDVAPEVVGAPGCPIGIEPIYTIELARPMDFRAVFAHGPPAKITYDWRMLPPDHPPVVRKEIIRPRFDLPTRGEYTIELQATVDDEACPLVVEVIHVPAPGLYFELVWETPLDPDPDDGYGHGTDLDLHLAHALADGGDFDGDGSHDPWFDARYDVHGQNERPEWTHTSTPPRLLDDDTDGFGPESLWYEQPQDGCYQIGVHYWDDWGYGPSTATLRIFVDDALTWELGSPELNYRELWHVAEVCWGDELNMLFVVQRVLVPATARYLP